MMLNELRMKREEILNTVMSNNGSQVKVFGSTAKGLSTENSDIDFLVKLNDNASLFDLVEIKLELEELLGKKVDVVSENGLKNNDIGNDIRKSAIAI